MNRSRIFNYALVAVLGTVAAMGQDEAGWRRFGDQNAGQPPQQQQNMQQNTMQQPNGPQQNMQNFQQPLQDMRPIVVPAGTWITVHANQPLSSHHSQPGDSFTASLAQPIVAEGVVVARRGETVGGRVSQALRAGRVKGTSQLSVELTELTLVDGQQVPIRTQGITRQGNTSVGRDVVALGTTTGLGAAIGAAAGGGIGAAIGAGAGAVLGTTGVLATRGEDTILYPETLLTFRLDAPLTISSRNSQAFVPPAPGEYERQLVRNPGPPQPRPGYYGAPYRAPYAAPYAPYPYYGTSIYFYGGGPRYYGRGYYRRW